MYIIVEYLLLENFIINYLILYIIKIILKIDIDKRRLIVGGILSALYTLVNFYPNLFYLTTPIFKILFSVFIIRISFKYIGIRLFLKQLAAFYLISFIFAGTSLGVFYFTQNMSDILMGKININKFPIGNLILGVGISFFIIKYIFTYFYKKMGKESYMANLNVHYKGKDASLKALIDTGNSLVDPFTKKKVIIVEYEKIRDLIPSSMETLIKEIKSNDYEKIEFIMEELAKEINLIMIPFNSVGKSGILYGFAPEYIEIDYMDTTTRVDNIIVGIYGGSLSEERGFSGLLQYDLVNGGLKYDEVEV